MAATHELLSAGQVKAGPRFEMSQHSANAVPVWVDPEEARPTQYYVYLHTISKRAFNQPHPIFREVRVPACPKDKRYVTFMKIGHPVQTPTVDAYNPSNPPELVIADATRCALAVCSPNYRSRNLDDQDKDFAPEAQITSGCNLTQQGVFASRNAVPTEEELKKAEARRVKYYKEIFQEANEVMRSAPGKLNEILTEDHHLAAEMFGIDVDWHKLTTPKIECPNCGEKIKDGIAYHFSNGRICILNWKDAYLAGAVKKEDIPEQVMWDEQEEKKSRETKATKTKATKAEAEVEAA